MRKAKKGTGIGKNNPNWRGGKSPFYQYQKYRMSHCSLCGTDRGGPKRKILSVHHIDGNRANNDPENITTLCEKCHCEVHKSWLNRKRRKNGQFA